MLQELFYYLYSLHSSLHIPHEWSLTKAQSFVVIASSVLFLCVNCDRQESCFLFGQDFMRLSKVKYQILFPHSLKLCIMLGK